MSFFRTRHRPMLLCAAIAVTLLALAHSTMPSVYVWHIAAAFAVAMNLNYVIEAIARQRFVRTEIWFAVGVTALALIGLFTTPLLVIAALLLHAVWDVAKHLGIGVPFSSQFTLGCFAVCLAYSGALLFHWVGQT